MVVDSIFCVPQRLANVIILFRDTRFPYRVFLFILKKLGLFRDMEIASPKIWFEGLNEMVVDSIFYVPQWLANVIILFRNSLFPYRVFYTFLSKHCLFRDMEIASPGIWFEGINVMVVDSIFRDPQQLANVIILFRNSLFPYRVFYTFLSKHCLFRDMEIASPGIWFEGINVMVVDSIFRDPQQLANVITLFRNNLFPYRVFYTFLK